MSHNVIKFVGILILVCLVCPFEVSAVVKIETVVDRAGPADPGTTYNLISQTPGAPSVSAVKNMDLGITPIPDNCRLTVDIYDVVNDWAQVTVTCTSTESGQPESLPDPEPNIPFEIIAAAGDLEPGSTFSINPGWGDEGGEIHYYPIEGTLIVFYADDVKPLNDPIAFVRHFYDGDGDEIGRIEIYRNGVTVRIGTTWDI